MVEETRVHVPRENHWSLVKELINFLTTRIPKHFRTYRHWTKVFGRLEGNINSENYINILENNLWPVTQIVILHLWKIMIHLIALQWQLLTKMTTNPFPWMTDTLLCMSCVFIDLHLNSQCWIKMAFEYM